MVISKNGSQQFASGYTIQEKRLTSNIERFSERKSNKVSKKNPTVKKPSSTFAPALTAHPTSPLSFDFQILQYSLSQALNLKQKESLLEKRQDITENEKSLKQEKLHEKTQILAKENNIKEKLPLNDIIKKLAENLAELPIIAPKPLTPDEEVDLGLNTVYPELFKKSTSIIRHALQDDLDSKNLFDLHTWSGGDADGNINVTPQVTRDTVKKHAQKAAELYKDDILLTFPDAPKELIEQFDKTIKGEGDIIQTTKDLNNFLDEEIKKSSDKVNPAHVLKAKLDNFPLTGPKLDIRQSSEATDETLKKIITDVLGHPSDTAEAVTTSGNPLRTDFLKELLNNEEDLKKIVNYVKNNPENNLIELDRMLAVQENPATIQRVRISDGRDADDVRTLRIFEKIAQKILGIDEKPTTDFIILAETEQDIVNLPKIAEKVLEEGLNLQGQLTLFPGYSDAEKRMGLTGLLTISKALTDTIDVVKKYEDKNNTKINLTISHGGGEDITRNGGKIKPDSTKQGREGMELALGDNLKQELQILAGKEDSVYSQAQEMQTVIQTPELKEAMENYIKNSRVPYRTMVEHPNVKGNKYEDIPITPLGDVTAHTLQGDNKWFYNLVKQGNKSSRAGAKSSKASAKLNLDKERAIGLASLFTASGTGAQVLGGLPKYDNMKSDMKNIKILFKTSSVMQDIIFKSLYTAAITDFNRAGLIAGLDKPLLPKDVLTYTNDNIFSPAGIVPVPKNDNDDVVFSYTPAHDIKAKFDSNEQKEQKNSVKLWLENNLRHAIDATRAMIAIVSENDDALKIFDKSLKEGETLAKATQNFLKNSKDTMFESLGKSAEKTVQEAGLPFTNILMQYGQKLGDNDIKDEDTKKAQDAALLLIREEQTVPKILREFASMSDKESH